MVMGRGSHVVVNGIRTRVEVRGDGPPLLLIMGFWGDLRAWDELLPELDGFRTIAFDAPGIGGTATGYPHAPWSLAGFAAGVLDAVGVARAHVLGISHGGVVAQQLAVLTPSRIDRLVLVSTSSAVIHLPGNLARLLPLIWPFGTHPDPGALFGGRVRTHPELLERLNLKPPHDPSAYLQRLSALSGWWGLPWRITQPTLVITGDDDPIVPASNSRLLARILPDARLHVVRGGGHLVALDTPRQVGPVIANFLGGRARTAVLGNLAA